MKRIAVTAALLSLVATSAFAEHKLLITEVPDPGKVEARVDLVYSNLEGKKSFFEVDNLTGDLVKVTEKIRDKQTSAVATIGIGVVKGLKLSASLPYTFVQQEEGIKKDGFGDIALGARFVPTKSLVKLPFDAAIGIDWKTTTASDGEENKGTGRNNYAPYLAVSKNLHTVIPYVKYQPEFIVKEHRGQTIHNLTAGAEIEFSHHYSLDVAVKASANGRYEGFKAANDVEFEVVPYINVTGNLYLLPRVAYKVIGDRSWVNGRQHFTDTDEYTLGLGCYYLF